jgi:hypothetical protein
MSFGKVNNSVSLADIVEIVVILAVEISVILAVIVLAIRLFMKRASDFTPKIG